MKSKPNPTRRILMATSLVPTPNPQITKPDPKQGHNERLNGDKVTKVPQKTRKRNNGIDRGGVSSYVKGADDDGHPIARGSSSTLMVSVLPFLQFGFDSRGSVSL
jgi:hypothetical protein